MSVSGIIVAAGTGSRMGAGINKVYMPVADKCVLWYTVNAFYKSCAVDELVIVTGAEDIQKCRNLTEKFDIECKITEGGATRQDSVLNGLKAAGYDYAAVHDGARALITPEEVKNVINAAKEYGAAALGVRPKDTVKTSDSDGFIHKTVLRESAYLIQTPQVFLRKDLIKAHEAAKFDGFSATDDCMLMERMGIKIKIVEGNYENIKLTTPEDMYTAERILKKRGAEA